MKFTLLLSLLFTFNIHAEVKAPLSDDDKICQSVTPDELKSYDRLIKRFGGTSVNSEELERNEEGLQAYLDSIGIKNFSSSEITTPNNEKDAHLCGISNLIPPQCIWSNGAALLTIFESIRDVIEGPISVRNWWRPTCYNSLVEGAKASDHLLAKSFDLDFKNSQDRATAQKFLCEKLWKKGENVQVGIGCNSLHVGLGSPKGKRYWFYGSINNCKIKSKDSCWKL